jgi:DNA-binding NarL/FixJ family response regulator
MRIESAISLIGVMMEALVHRKSCLRVAEKDLPDELLAAALAKLEAAGRDTSGVREWLSSYGVHPPQNAQAPYRRRANNQVSDRTEVLIRELLDCGWTKSAIARQLKINRRVVIRVAREMVQTAQKCMLTRC